MSSESVSLFVRAAIVLGRIVVETKRKTWKRLIGGVAILCILTLSQFASHLIVCAILLPVRDQSSSSLVCPPAADGNITRQMQANRTQFCSLSSREMTNVCAILYPTSCLASKCYLRSVDFEMRKCGREQRCFRIVPWIVRAQDLPVSLPRRCLDDCVEKDSALMSYLDGHRRNNVSVAREWFVGT